MNWKYTVSSDHLDSLSSAMNGIFEDLMKKKKEKSEESFGKALFLQNRQVAEVVEFEEI